jgi:hypothetical protein
MTKIIKGVLASLVVFACMTVISDVKATCGTPNGAVIVGGYVVTRVCDGTTMKGVGTTLDDAVANVNGLAALLPHNVKCTYSDVTGGPGAFVAKYVCRRTDSTGGPISSSANAGGIGGTLTDAGTNALGFAQLFAATNLRCEPSEVVVVPGGYVSAFSCRDPNATGGPLNTFAKTGGIGMTSTDAGINNLGFAEVYAAVGNRCYTKQSDIKISGPGFEVKYTCTGSNVTGYGSTLTSAGADALIQVQ